MEARVILLEEVMPRIEKRLDQIDARLDRIDARFDRMDARFDRIEARAEARAETTDARLRAVEQSNARLEGKIDVLADQIVAKLPTWWQMLAMFVAIAALLNGLPLLTQYLHNRGLL